MSPPGTKTFTICLPSFALQLSFQPIAGFFEWVLPVQIIHSRLNRKLGQLTIPNALFGLLIFNFRPNFAADPAAQLNGASAWLSALNRRLGEARVVLSSGGMR